MSAKNPTMTYPSALAVSQKLDGAFDSLASLLNSLGFVLDDLRSRNMEGAHSLLERAFHQAETAAVNLRAARDAAPVGVRDDWLLTLDRAQVDAETAHRTLRGMRVVPTAPEPLVKDVEAFESNVRLMRHTVAGLQAEFNQDIEPRLRSLHAPQ